MQEKTEFKETEIGLIPYDWDLRFVSEVAAINESSIKKGFEPEYIEYIDIASVDKGRVTNKQFLELKEAPSRAKRILKDNDILISSVRPNLKHYAFINNVKPNTIASTGFVVVSAKKINPNFLYYYLTTDKYTNYLTAIADSHTSAYPSFNPDIIEKSQIPFPSESEQNSISKILSDLDKKIEINQKMNQTLEEIGQAIFKHWFVHYEFPNEEGNPYKSSGGEMVDSELGEIPGDWEIVSVSDAIEINPKLKVNRDKDKIHVPMTGLSKNSMIITEFEVRKSNSGAKFQNNDTLFARITPSAEHGKTGFVQFLKSDEEVAIGSTEFIVMRSRTVNPYYVYCLARYEKLRKHAINSMTGTSGRQRVQNDCFNSFFIAQPDENSLFRFEKFMKPMFQKIEILNKESQNLSIIRDSLLPKLMSGKIRVK